jgi:hypothetical protein
LAGKLLRGQDGALVQNLDKKRGYRYRSITAVRFQITCLLRDRPDASPRSGIYKLKNCHSTLKAPRILLLRIDIKLTKFLILRKFYTSTSFPLKLFTAKIPPFTDFFYRPANYTLGKARYYISFTV